MNIAKDDSLSSVIVDRKYVFINFSFEKLRSLDATVTGIVNKILQDIHA